MALKLKTINYQGRKIFFIDNSNGACNQFGLQNFHAKKSNDGSAQFTVTSNQFPLNNRNDGSAKFTVPNNQFHVNNSNDGAVQFTIPNNQIDGAAQFTVPNNQFTVQNNPNDGSAQFIVPKNELHIKNPNNEAVQFTVSKNQFNLNNLNNGAAQFTVQNNQSIQFTTNSNGIFPNQIMMNGLKDAILVEFFKDIEKSRKKALTKRQKKFITDFDIDLL